jgi:hypothetical protein
VFQNNGFIYEDHEALVYVESYEAIAKPQRRAELTPVKGKKERPLLA